MIINNTAPTRHSECDLTTESSHVVSSGGRGFEPETETHAAEPPPLAVIGVGVSLCEQLAHVDELADRMV